MAKIVHALFEEVAAAEDAARELARNCDAHGSFAVQLHRERVIDGNALPECGTEIGRNTMMAAGFGAAMFGIGGAVAGATLNIVGLDAAMGAGVGLVGGALVGYLSGMMAGTRKPKRALLELAESLGTGRVLATVESRDTDVSLVEDELERFGGTEIGSC